MYIHVEIDTALRPFAAALVASLGFAAVVCSQLAWFDKLKPARGLLLAAGIVALIVGVSYYLFNFSAL